MQDPNSKQATQNGPPFAFRPTNHRRAHSEVNFRLPEDLDLVSDPFDAPVGSGFDEMGSEDDLFSTYMDIEKLGRSNSNSNINEAGSLLPMPMVYYAFWALGVRVYVKGNPPPPVNNKSNSGRSGVLFICSHRTLLDPIFLSTALGRPILAVTYSVSRLSEIISPIKTVRLSRDRAVDASMIKKLLQEGDLAICPEGTTCREPFL